MPGSGVGTFQLARSIRYDRRVKKKAVAALEALGERAHPERFLDIERIVLGEPRHEAQHCNLRVTVDEDLLDEAVGREAGDGIRFAAASLWEASERTLPAFALSPSAPRAVDVDHVRLDVEDKVLAGQRFGGGHRLVGAFFRQDEGAADPGCRREDLLVREQSRRRAAEPREKCAPRDRKSTRLNSSHTVISYAVF